MAIGNYTDEQVAQFVRDNANNPAAIAQQAAQLGLNESQIQQALQLGGINASTQDITSQAQNLGYNFGGAGGTIQPSPGQSSGAGQPAQQATLASGLTNVANQASSQSMATPTQDGGMNIGGTYYTQQQIKDFFASGGDPTQWAQQHGITNLDQIHQLATQARQIAGTSNPTGDAALQAAFKQYQQFSPGGAQANNYSEWVKSLNPEVASAIRAGTYSGQLGATSTKDFEPGGIYGPGSAYYGKVGYGSGLGPRGMGDLGGGYGSTGAATAPAGSTSAPAGGGGTTGAGSPMAGLSGTTIGPGGMQGLTGVGGGVTGGSGFGFASAATPMANRITAIQNQGVQYGLSEGLNPANWTGTTGAPSGGAQASQVASGIGSLLGVSGNVLQGQAQPGNITGGTATPANVQSGLQTAATGAQSVQGITAAPLGTAPGQATTQAQKFQSMVSALPPGTPAQFGQNAQLMKTQDGRIIVSSPALRQPFVLDTSLPQSQQMQQLQAVFDLTNAQTV